jgi:hypothetical protein
MTGERADAEQAGSASLPAPLRGNASQTCVAFAAPEARAQSLPAPDAERLGSIILPVAY